MRMHPLDQGVLMLSVSGCYEYILYHSYLVCHIQYHPQTPCTYYRALHWLYIQDLGFPHSIEYHESVQQVQVELVAMFIYWR